MPIFALVELELYGLPQFEVGQTTQDVLGLNHTSEVRKCLGESIRRKTVRQSLNNHMSRGRALLERERHADHFFPLFLYNAQISGFGEQGGEDAVVDKPIDAIQLLVFEVPDTGHKIEAQQMTQGKERAEHDVGTLAKAGLRHRHGTLPGVSSGQASDHRSDYGEKCHPENPTALKASGGTAAYHASA